MTHLTEKEEQQLRVVVFAKMKEAEIQTTADQFDRFWLGVLRNFETLLSVRVFDLKAEFLKRETERLHCFRESTLKRTPPLLPFLLGVLVGGILMASCIPY